jgi:proline dehydrogenase
MDYELMKAKKFNLPIGMKFVRGAYMVEENEIAKNLKLESPICDTYDNTNNNYHRNVENYFKANLNNSAVVIASHNEDSCEQVKQLITEFKIQKNSGTKK